MSLSFFEVRFSNNNMNRQQRKELDRQEIAQELSPLTDYERGYQSYPIFLEENPSEDFENGWEQAKVDNK